MRRLLERGRRWLLRAGACGGFTLVEVLAATGILGITLGLVGTGVFQAVGFERTWRDDVGATRTWRHAASVFAGDAMNAETTDLVDGALPVASVTFTWTDVQGVGHTVTYQQVGDVLRRDFDGQQMTVARRVVSVGFSLSGRMLTFDLEVEAAQGATEGMSLQTYLRWLQP